MEERKFSERVDESEVFSKELPVEPRKLATIEVIKDLQPIEDADAIEVATIRGWKVVVKKGEFKIGDLCVYCEIDSVLPPRPEFAFLEKVKYRIKTIKLRGQVSQGICFSLDILPDAIRTSVLEEGHLVGMNVTETLGVTKYEPPIPAQLAGKVKGVFPSFIRRTDEERIQNMDWVLSEYQGIPFFVTEKLDGTSFTVYYNNGELGVCSRNLDLLETEDNTYWKLTRELELEEKLRQYGYNIALQGEIIGEGIQKNKYALKGQHVYFFNIFDIDKYRYYDYKMFTDRIFEFGLKTVPIVSPVNGYYLPKTVDEILEYSNAPSQLNVNIPREGIVVRPYDEIEHVKYGRISFKVISNDFLLKYKE